ncbi:hypothetical protein [Neobacillus ginsengisoli]|uniref:Type II secretory pathway predicted ATPase ExeA n=1 Tax=Neobacillus ginsengisoli TaxID=904295 RepID=A0ABT9Y245_9BACI|nr:hypothetical protein [Neobacillus ginsengisoli]MDQ0201237.1 type II secretory pathway predicted ATPase ExeA [Neobacillus ginsengisoli]
MVLTDDCGTGKTTTIRRFGDRLDKGKFQVLSLSHILVGQSELWDRLKLQSFAAKRQRIDIQF